MDFTSILLIRHLTDITDINICIETIYLRTYKIIHIRRFNGAVNEQYLFDKLGDYIYSNSNEVMCDCLQCDGRWCPWKAFINGFTNKNTIIVGYESIRFIATDCCHNYDKRLDSNVIYKKYLSISDILSEYCKISSRIDIRRYFYSILCENTKCEQIIEYINDHNVYDEGDHYVIAFLFGSD